MDKIHDVVCVSSFVNELLSKKWGSLQWLQSGIGKEKHSVVGGLNVYVKVCMLANDSIVCTKTCKTRDGQYLSGIKFSLLPQSATSGWLHVGCIDAAGKFVCGLDKWTAYNSEAELDIVLKSHDLI